MDTLLKEIIKCKACENHLSHSCNPVLSISNSSQILIIGQAPGIKVHTSGKPWADKSGERLMEWLGIDQSVFYDNSIFGIMPMGFCYPGKGKTGDLPPRKECAPLWHDKILTHLSNPSLSILIGQYAQKYYLGNKRKSNLTETVRSFHEYLPYYFPLPHPSPRNNIWIKKNLWFEKEVIPFLQNTVASALKNL